MKCPQCGGRLTVKRVARPLDFMGKRGRKSDLIAFDCSQGHEIYDVAKKWFAQVEQGIAQNFPKQVALAAGEYLQAVALENMQKPAEERIDAIRHAAYKIAHKIETTRCAWPTD